ncbi:MAG: hypothetical protein LIO46_03570, partial [Clostridiales bacterium]|nr:hypothetical protein [Clostridiales bacterium]
TAQRPEAEDMREQLRGDERQNDRVPDLEEEIAPPVKPASLRIEDAMDEEDEESESADEEDAASFRDFFKRNK